MNTKLMQLRNSIKAKIKESPTIISFNTYPLKDDGFGGYVVDTSGTPVAHKERVRVSHESASIPTNETTPTGYDTSYSLFLLAEYDSEIQETCTIEYLDETYKIGPVDNISRFGGVYFKQAVLTKVS